MMRHACRVACCVAILLVLACPGIAPTADDKEAPADENEKNVQWGEQLEGYQLSLSTDKAEFAPGEPVGLHIVFKNVGSDDVRVTRMSFMPLYRISVLLPNGEEAPPTLYGQKLAESALRGGSRATVVLKPGEELSTDMHLSRLFDMTLTGTYKVTAKRAVWSRGEPRETVHVVSNTLEIRIRERPLTKSE